MRSSAGLTGTTIRAEALRRLNQDAAQPPAAPHFVIFGANFDLKPTKALTLNDISDY
jgi:hypothetical protein